MKGFAGIPSHWKISRIDRVATVNARIGWKALTAAEYQDEGFAFLSTPNIKNAKIDFENVNYISEFRYRESPELQLAKGDVLLTKDGFTLGTVNVVRDLPRPATVNGSIAVLRPFAIHPVFLQYVIASSITQDSIQAVKDGMDVLHLFQRDIKKLEIPLPDTEEQQRIANFLDTETARIDSLATDRVRQRAVLEERSYAEVSESLLPGILTGARGNRPWHWLPDIPTGSPLVRLGYICRLQNGLTVDGKRDVNGDAVKRPYLRVANVQAGYVNLTNVTEIIIPRNIARRCTLRPGDVLMTEGGDLDKLGRGTVWNGEIPDCLHQNHVFALRPEPDRLDGDYLALMTQTMHGRCYFESTGSKTTNLASTNSSKILSFPIPLPPVSRQRELVHGVHTKLDVIRRTKHSLDRQLALLAERRQALITTAVTGQIDVSTASGRGVED
ncbi:restriction endonuclease subunit S [Micromonospora rifamycinica]|uniref:restriction endonuclease subunit S n=1 Tax=Micromonospora rifamycinica TaxID=291594 RepID=UPI0033DB2856